MPCVCCISFRTHALRRPLRVLAFSRKYVFFFMCLFPLLSSLQYCIIDEYLEALSHIDEGTGSIGKMESDRASVFHIISCLAHRWIAVFLLFCSWTWRYFTHVCTSIQYHFIRIMKLIAYAASLFTEPTMPWRSSFTVAIKCLVTFDCCCISCQERPSLLLVYAIVPRNVR